jgi:GrpB-like predicted nucleotidyltransferase (UPF0157 family)
VRAVLAYVLGAPGSGKSAVAGVLQTVRPDLIVLDWDSLMTPASELAGRDVRTSPATWPAYRRLVRTVVDALAVMPTAVLGVCTPDELEDWPIDAWMLLDCTDEERARRLSSRATEVEAALADAARYRTLGLPVIDTTDRRPEDVALELADLLDGVMNYEVARGTPTGAGFWGAPRSFESPEPPELLTVDDYDPAWPGLFAHLGRRLRSSLGPVAVRIDHIGSTAVVGLDAKPIIDVQISVASLEPVAAYRGSLEHCGFVWRADNPELTKRYFRETPGDRRTHIHVRAAGSFDEQFSLLFRDYLRAHPVRAHEYAELKRRLAVLHQTDRYAYVEAKGPFIWETMRIAGDWAQQIGWAPGPSDA